jgi:hypothetical protein
MIGKASYATSFNDSNTLNIGSFLFAVNAPNANTTDSTTVGAARIGIGQRNPTAFLHLPQSSASHAPLRIPQGANVTSSNEGEMWNQATPNCLKMNIGGTVYIINIVKFTPSNDHDPTYPNGTVAVDDSFIWYRNSGGIWVKAAFGAF